MLNIQDFMIPIVLVFCLCIGYVYKHLIPKDNKFIPLIMFVIGAVCGCIALGAFNFENIVKGAVTGLASTGLYETFTQLIEHPKAGSENGSNYADLHEELDPEDADADVKGGDR